MTSGSIAGHIKILEKKVQVVKFLVVFSDTESAGEDDCKSQSDHQDMSKAKKRKRQGSACNAKRARLKPAGVAFCINLSNILL